MKENQTSTCFLRSRLFTYDIMKKFNCNISLCFLNQSLGLILENIKKKEKERITACMPLMIIISIYLYTILTKYWLDVLMWVTGHCE